MDVVISFDTTGSMYPCLTEVRRKVKDFIHTLFQQVPDLHMSIIAHGDYCDNRGPYSIIDTGLTTDEHKLCKFVETVQPTNGGDSDECYEAVLKLVSEYIWKSDKRIFILIGDCLPHPVGYRYGNLYGNFHVTTDWKDTAAEIVRDNVTLYAVQCLARTNCTSFYKHLSYLSNTPKLDLHQFSDIIPALTAVVYRQQSEEALQDYGQELHKIGRLNRGLAQFINTLLSKNNAIADHTYTERTADELEAVSPSRFQRLHVDTNTAIKSFVLSSGAVFERGKGFYQLTKSELVQERKEVILVNSKGDMFSGSKARELIHLPYGERGTIRPDRDLPYTVFVQSTSDNRKLIGGTMFLYEVDYT